MCILAARTLAVRPAVFALTATVALLTGCDIEGPSDDQPLIDCVNPDRCEQSPASDAFNAWDGLRSQDTARVAYYNGSDMPDSTRRLPVTFTVRLSVGKQVDRITFQRGGRPASTPEKPADALTVDTLAVRVASDTGSIAYRLGQASLGDVRGVIEVRGPGDALETTWKLSPPLQSGTEE